MRCSSPFNVRFVRVTPWPQNLISSYGCRGKLSSCARLYIFSSGGWANSTAGQQLLTRLAHIITAARRDVLYCLQRSGELGSQRSERT